MSYITENTLTRFEDITTYDAKKVYERYVVFYNTYYTEYLSYYRGTINEVSENAVSAFEKLKQEVNSLDSYITTNDDKFERYDMWDLVDQLDQMKGFVKKIQSLDRIMRSSRVGGVNKSSLVVEYQPTDGETPENVVRIDSTDSQNDWVNVYRDNLITERDYEATEGGYTVNFNRTNSNRLFLNNVIDNLIGKNLYGKDIDPRMIYEGDDWKILTGKDTFIKAVEISAALVKGDIPEYHTLGISPNLIFGATSGYFRVPFVVREMTEVFSQDDTMLGFTIKNVETKGDSVFVKFDVQSFYDFIYNENVELR